MMTASKILETLKFYRQYFESNKIPKGSKLTGSPRSSWQIMMHCHAMIDKIEEFISLGDIGKAERWFGFLQGCLWSIGIFDLEKLRDYNRR